MNDATVSLWSFVAFKVLVIGAVAFLQAANADPPLSPVERAAAALHVTAPLPLEANSD